MLTLQVLVGMIASGKSTFSGLSAIQGKVIVNDDAVVKLVHGGDYQLYDISLKLLYKSIENHVAGTALALGRSVVIDRGLNVSERGRRRWIGLAHSFDACCEAVVFTPEAPEVHAQRRFDKDNRGHTLEYWQMVARTHYEQFRVPTLSEGFDKVTTVAPYSPALKA